jgi:hypothetical protein
MEIGGIKRDNTIINKGRQTGHENLLQIISWSALAHETQKRACTLMIINLELLPLLQAEHERCYGKSYTMNQICSRKKTK